MSVRAAGPGPARGSPSTRAVGAGGSPRWPRSSGPAPGHERDDRHIRALNRASHLRAAIAFDTSYARGNSAFTQYDNALLAVIAINQHAFSAAITAGQHGVNGWTGVVPAAAVILIIVLLLAGVLPRLAEYRE